MPDRAHMAPTQLLMFSPYQTGAFLRGKINVTSDFQKKELSPLLKRCPLPQEPGLCGTLGGGGCWDMGGCNAQFPGRGQSRIGGVGVQGPISACPCSSCVPHGVAAAATVAPLGRPGPRHTARAADGRPHPGRQPGLVLMAPAVGGCPLSLLGLPNLTRGGLCSLCSFPRGLVPCPAGGRGAQSLCGAGRVAQGDSAAGVASPVPPGALLSPCALLSGINPLAPNPSCPQASFIFSPWLLSAFGGLPRAERASPPACSPPRAAIHPTAEPGRGRPGAGRGVGAA